MGGYPTISCKVAFESNPYDTTDVWTDVGPASGAGPGGLGWMRDAQLQRGRERLLRSQAQFQAGKATVTLDNRDRRFDPTNTAGPYYPSVQPEKKIQVGATWQGTYYPIFTGYVDDWPQTWPGMAEGYVPLPATDLFKELSVKRLVTSLYPGQVVADGAYSYFRLTEPYGSTLVFDFLKNVAPAPVSGDIQFGLAGALPAVASSAALIGAGNPAAQLAPGVIGLPYNVWGPATTSWAVEFWYNSALTGNLFLVATNAAFPAGIIQVEVPGTGHVAVITKGPGSETGFATGAVTVTDGNWHHVMVTFAPAGPGTITVTVMVDGAADTSTTVVFVGSGALGALTSVIVSNLSTPGLGNTAAIEELAFYPYAPSVSVAASHYRLLAWPQEFTGGRAARVMGLIGLPAGEQRVDIGHTYCTQDRTDLVSTKALTYLQKLEQTEQGQCFMAADGAFVFQDRYHRYRSPNTAPVATLGDGAKIGYPSEVPYAMGGVTLNFDRMELFNEIPTSRRNGAQQVVVNAASAVLYGDRTMPGLSDLLMETDQDALYAAQWVLADVAYPQLRPGDVILDPTCDDRLWPLVLGLDIGAVVTVYKHQVPGGGAPVALTCRIEGIEHQITPPRSWKTTWHLSLVGLLPWCIYNDPVMGIYNSGARWGW